MTAGVLKQRVAARDHLADAAEAVGLRFEGEALAALRSGLAGEAEAAVRRGAASVEALAESLRGYQAELHAQAEELQAAQARTELSLARFTSLFGHLPVAAMLIGARAEIIDTNAQARRLFDQRPRASARRFFHRLLNAEHYQRIVRPAFLEARAVGASLCSEVEFVAETGSRFWGELHIAALPAAGADDACYACAVVDRTEPREALRKLHELNRRLAASEAFLSDSAQLARIGGWDYDVPTQAMRWTTQMRTIHEVDEAHVPTLESAIGFCAPASQPLLRAALDAALAANTDFDLELDLVTAGGRPLRVRVVGHPELRDGRCMRVSGVFQDITQQQQARQAIDDLSRRLELAREAGGIGIWDCDLLQDRAYIDNGMRTLLGLQNMPTAGLSALFDAVLDTDEAARLHAAIEATLAGATLAIELRLASSVAAERYLHLAGRAEHAADGRATRLIGCAWDSTSDHLAARLLAAKEVAEAGSRAKSAFLSRMSHELRTPLNAILGFSQLMRMEADAGDLVMKPHRLQFIETAARHLLDLVNEVLDVSAIESGQLRLVLQPLDAGALVRECVPLVVTAAEQAGISIRVEDGGAALTVQADRLRLKEVLINLLSNAVKYNRRGGDVTVALRADAAGPCIEVRDSGRGMDSQQLAGLYEPFNRVGAESTQVPGTGMGLFVSKRFVDLMGGTIDVQSEPGIGTTFRLRLPAPSAAPTLSPR